MTENFPKLMKDNPQVKKSQATENLRTSNSNKSSEMKSGRGRKDILFLEEEHKE